MVLHAGDTSGRSDHDSLRPLCFEGAHVVLLCFSLVSRTSMTNLRMKWAPMLKHYAPRAGYAQSHC